MSSLEQAAQEFLALKRIAVAGVSRDAKQPANLIFRRLRTAGIEVFAVNPNADDVEGGPSFHDLKSIPGGVDGVVVATPPDVALSVVTEWPSLRSDGSGSTALLAPEACLTMR